MKSQKLQWSYRLLRYQYKYDNQGSDEYGIDYALIYAPEDASFNNIRSVLFNQKHKEYYYEIDIDSVEDMTIKW
jgi:hypothetical protein